MEMRNRLTHVLIAGATVLVGAGVCLSGTALAQSTLSDEWKFRVIPYFWVANISATAKFPGDNTADIHASFSDILDHLKMTGMGALEVQKGRLGAFTDVLYMNLGGVKARARDGTIDGVPLPAGVTLNTGADLKAWTWTLAGSYRVQSSPDLEMDIFAGARYFSLQPTLNYSFNVDVGPFVGPGRGGTRSVKGKVWDAIVGTKGRIGFGSSGEWFIPYYFDIGTGDSDLTWQASGGVGYKFSWGDALLTYRYLDFNFKSSSKLEGQTLKGPVLGVALSW